MFPLIGDISALGAAMFAMLAAMTVGGCVWLFRVARLPVCPECGDRGLQDAEVGGVKWHRCRECGNLW